MRSNHSVINVHKKNNIKSEVVTQLLYGDTFKKLKKNEELSYDYGFSFDCNYKDHICECGSKNCVGYIIREGSRWRLKKQANI